MSCWLPLIACRSQLRCLRVEPHQNVQKPAVVVVVVVDVVVVVVDDVVVVVVTVVGNTYEASFVHQIHCHCCSSWEAAAITVEHRGFSTPFKNTC